MGGGAYGCETIAAHCDTRRLSDGGSGGTPAQTGAPPDGSSAQAEHQQAGKAGDFDPGVARRITAEEVKKRIDAGQKVTILDTRSKFVGPKVKGAAHVPEAEIDAWAKDVPKDTFIVAYCT